jgi:hypothetical protein
MLTMRHPVRSVRSLVTHLRTLDRRVGELHSAVRQTQDKVTRTADAVAEVRDSVHLAARATTFRRRSTRVPFLVHLIAAWDSCQELYELMVAADDFEPIVASIPRHFRGHGPPTFEEEVHQALEERGVPHLRLVLSEPGPFGVTADDIASPGPHTTASQRAGMTSARSRVSPSRCLRRRVKRKTQSSSFSPIPRWNHPPRARNLPSAVPTTTPGSTAGALCRTLPWVTTAAIRRPSLLRICSSPME